MRKGGQSARIAAGSKIFGAEPVDGNHIDARQVGKPAPLADGARYEQKAPRLAPCPAPTSAAPGA